MLSLILALLLTCLAYIVYNAVYNVYFHPLSKYPGPPLWVFSQLGEVVAFASGRYPQEFARLHSKYGDVVRYAPSKLAFFTPNVWQDVYAHNKQKTFIKDPSTYKPSPGSVSDMLDAEGEVHRRYRGLVSRAFSDRSLREQRPIIDKHIDRLMQRLREASADGRPVSLHKWFHYMAFDVIGNLALGQDFGCLTSSENHTWSDGLGSWLMSIILFKSLEEWLPMRSMLPWVPRFLLRTVFEHMDKTQELVRRRLAEKTDRQDYVHFILHPGEKRGMSEQELTANMAIILVAGSESTATTVAGTVYFLLKTPAVLERLQNEVRSRFREARDITIDELSNFEYLNAVIKETMRLYPGSPDGLPRYASSDALVDGYDVPKGTSVSLQPYGAYRSPRNFSDPLKFEPLRWTSEGRREQDRLDIVEPFSIGPRTCVGQKLAWTEIWLVLTRLLLEFDLELLDDGFDIAKQNSYVVWEAPPLMVKLRVRSHAAPQLKTESRDDETFAKA
ncbi:MAG: hypothetical protein M1821_005960 [Bathelium mastoideum]|nr:MAG: hypothetical protein M1821_005960 [Bathelium mastoideum]KAI9688502.1 MAG: hypothetical protein M1822_001451 [Bathelium mastoideum]